MPRVNIINDTGKPIVFWITNEKNLLKKDFDDFEQNLELKK